MKPSKNDIEDIAELLDCGEICFFHKINGAIEHHPDPNDDFFDDYLWKDLITKIESDFNNYIKFKKMDSRLAFKIMENFANSLSNLDHQNNLLNLLSKPNPFKNFKLNIEHSYYRKQWFDFKKQAYINWVNDQLE